ncbi:hypothetical protein [Natrinema thermotolerans]|uniref:hypothetical protein n=1 Tax=Natrinema thermotolerans TaxID=121872 RepID=UPI00067932AD|nr:hypothetical protein [Natrinema thermotolerans]QCC57338.1 hypothetical protein DVR14_01265 [Natrinema thermotolerans]
MTADADGLRRLADVVDALGETAIETDNAHLLEANEEQIRGRVTVTVPVDGDLLIAGTNDVQESEPETTDDPDPDETADEEDEADEEDGEDEDGAETNEELLDHTSTEDLQRAYDEADGNISVAADRFEVSYGAVYQRMVNHGVHETENDGDNTNGSGTSTEDDTPTSDVDSESEAEEDVVLEGDSADDDAGDAGVDVQEETDSDTDRVWCGWCGRKYVDEEAVRDHCKNDHDKEPAVLEAEPDLECDGCGRLFYRRSGLTNHQNSTACGAKLPGDIDEEDLETIVENSDSLLEVKRELRTLKRPQVRHLLEERDLLSELAVESGSPKQAVESIGDPFDDDEPVEHPDWLARDADEIVETSPVDCSLAELLEIVSAAESATFARQQIDSSRPQKVQDLLWQLGLRNADGSLKGESELSDRVTTIRGVYVDD